MIQWRCLKCGARGIVEFNAGTMTLDQAWAHISEEHARTTWNPYCRGPMRRPIDAVAMRRRFELTAAPRRDSDGGAE